MTFIASKCKPHKSVNLFDVFMNIPYNFQMFVRAYDLGTPQRNSQNQATVRINVIRNNNCPIFQNLPANITITSQFNNNDRIYNISAVDNDPPVRI